MMRQRFAKRRIAIESLGARLMLTACTAWDSELGDDIHTGSLDSSSTTLSIDSAAAEVCSFIDRDADQDVFKFVASTSSVILTAAADIPLIVEVFDSERNLVDQNDVQDSASTSTIPTTPGVRYFVSVRSTKGGRGDYRVRVEAGDVPNADLDDNGTVGFSDFLILSGNYGKASDAVFAEGDINGDGAVNFADFLLLSKAYGTAE